MENQLTGVELIAKERQEQIEKHGRTVEQDVQYNFERQLSDAASMLASDSWGCNDADEMIEQYTPNGWDKDLFAKMMHKPHYDRLIIAGALIAAEIDRLQNNQQ